MAKIILSLQFLGSPVRRPYIQSIFITDCIYSHHIELPKNCNYKIILAILL